MKPEDNPIHHCHGCQICLSELEIEDEPTEDDLAYDAQVAQWERQTDR